MKIGYISDIHVDINKNYPIIDILIEEYRSRKLDHLIIAGDIANDYKVTLSTLDELKKADIPFSFIAGNHDLYDIDRKYPSTDFIYNELSRHENSIMDRDVILGDNEDIVILGDVMWYDYSMADTEHYSVEHIKEKTLNNRTWQDSKFIEWNVSDEDKAYYFIEKMRNRIRKYKDKKIITVTHMITHDYFLPHEYREDIGFFYAFFGSHNIGSMMMEEEVDINIMGHIHYRRSFKEKNTLFLCSCLNYEKEWQSSPKDAVLEVKDALRVIEL